MEKMEGDTESNTQRNFNCSNGFDSPQRSTEDENKSSQISVKVVYSSVLTSNIPTSSNGSGSGSGSGSVVNTSVPSYHDSGSSNPVILDSEEMKELKQHQREIHEWINLVNQRIYDLETSYLDEPNSLGNVIKGWDPDGRTFPVRRGPCEDKDRYFSNSSYQVWLDRRTQLEMENEKKSLIAKNESINSKQIQHKNKKVKRVGSSQMLHTEEKWDTTDEN